MAEDRDGGCWDEDFFVGALRQNFEASVGLTAGDGHFGALD